MFFFVCFFKSSYGNSFPLRRDKTVYSLEAASVLRGLFLWAYFLLISQINHSLAIHFISAYLHVVPVPQRMKLWIVNSIFFPALKVCNLFKLFTVRQQTFYSKFCMLLTEMLKIFTIKLRTSLFSLWIITLPVSSLTELLAGL